MVDLVVDVTIEHEIVVVTQTVALCKPSIFVQDICPSDRAISTFHIHSHAIGRAFWQGRSSEAPPDSRSKPTSLLWLQHARRRYDRISPCTVEEPWAELIKRGSCQWRQSCHVSWPHFRGGNPPAVPVGGAARRRLSSKPSANLARRDS